MAKIMVLYEADYLPQDRDQWRAVVNTGMSSYIPYNVGKLSNG
jgi:hypothetical protein